MARKRKRRTRNDPIAPNEDDTSTNSNSTEASITEEIETETILTEKDNEIIRIRTELERLKSRYALLRDELRNRRIVPRGKGKNTLKLSDMVATKPQNLVNYACVSKLITNNFFRSNKFMDDGWEQWSTVDQTLCSRVCSVIAYSEHIKTEEDKRRYWSEDLVPMVNKKMSCLKGNMTQKLKKVYMGKRIKLNDFFYDKH
jgi:hypothetical protein